MPEVSTLRLYLLRGLYLLIGAGLAVTIWPRYLAPAQHVSHMATVVRSLLTALSLFAFLGLRYPLKMLPLLLFELGWKLTWVLAFGLPQWRSGQLTAASRETLFGCLMGVVLVPLAVPWGHAFRHYVQAPGDRWREDGAEGR